MDVKKLLVQENPPTRREWCTLKQSVKNWTLYALVDRDAVEVQFIQLKPYTAMQLVFDAGDKIGEGVILGTAFSRVCYPDVYDVAVGYRIARIRCVRMIVKQLLSADPGDCDLGLPKAYDVLVAKWDRYRDAVEDILSVAKALEEEEAGETVPFEEVVAKLEVELGPYADATIKHPALDAEVGVDPAAEGDDESVGTVLVYTRAGQVR